MSKEIKQLSNSFSTGGGGINFETRVQTAFVVLMLTGGFAPCLPTWPIKKIKLQGKYEGYETDDLIVFTESADGEKAAKLLGQVKHKIKITEGDKVFSEVIQAALSDFRNTRLFSEGSDRIALITGPLSITDTNDVRTILEKARHSEDSSDFLNQINLANFSNEQQRRKLKVFQVHLKNANGEKDISADEMWRFMKSFYLLGYDLDIKTGVTLSLLHSLIEQYSQNHANALWAQILDEVQSANQNAGTITTDSLPEELRAAFQKQTLESIPASFVRTPVGPATIDWNHVSFAADLSIVNLLGSWNERSSGDKLIAGQLAKKEFSDWISTIREILQEPQCPLNLKNGQWTVARRLEMWHTLGPRLFDDHLDKFHQCAVDVLMERDPQFQLPLDERYAASIHGKVLTYSNVLRKGLAESLALLGSHPKALNNCSLNKPEEIAVVSVRKILCDADWVLWGSLNDQLPLLAEAAPADFLSAVEDALQLNPCPFDELFAQEGSGITGRNYMTGLLWALETLAWDEQYLSRAAVILGELASHDPGGQWGNRPANSLTTIFLPWLPQTIASVEKRINAIRTLQIEFPDVAWKLLLHLLPNHYQTTTGSRKPAWRGMIPKDWSDTVSQQEYWDQVLSYSDMLLDISKGNSAKLAELIEHLDKLPESAFDKLLEHIQLNDISAQSEEERLLIWTKLSDFVSKHRMHPDAKWALGSDLVERVEKITHDLAPRDTLYLYRRLFSQREFNLYDKRGSWKEQQYNLNERRNAAIQEILDHKGLQAVMDFAILVESPAKVGFSLGSIHYESADSMLLPKLLNSEDKKMIEYAGGYVWGRYQNKGWQWVDKIDVSEWNSTQIAKYFSCLPFTSETWNRANSKLGTAESEYWKIVPVNPYQLVEKDINYAIDKLLEYGRSNEAISCLFAMLNQKMIIDRDRSTRTLLQLVSSETLSHMDVYEILDVIKALQENPEMNQDDLFRIEWAYLPILEEHNGASPKLLAQKLATDPNFFCEVIRLVYKSDKEGSTGGELGERQQAIALNAYNLLRKWRYPPGIQSDAGFSGDQFNLWLESVKKACSESGHLEVALIHVGSVLIHCPSDPNGLWIHNAAASALNARDAEQMRQGFETAIFNSRGVHWVNSTAQPERDLARKYRQQANDVENAGYQRLAASLRQVADTYERQAERIISEHKYDKVEKNQTEGES